MVPRSQVGTAYGLLTALQNCGLFLTPLLVSMVYDRTSMVNPANPYAGVESLFACQASAACPHSPMPPLANPAIAGARACTRPPPPDSSTLSPPWQGGFAMLASLVLLCSPSARAALNSKAVPTA